MHLCPQCRTEYDNHVLICPRDGTVLEAERPTDPLIGQTLEGKYRLESQIGQGGMGTVYRATHLMLGKTVAVKVVNPALVGSTDVVRRFQREARAASSLIHPNIAAAYDLGQTPEGTLYIAMEFVQGESLKSIIRERGRLDTARITAVLKQVTSALSLAHSQQIIHRDLKPQNIMVAADRSGRDVAKLLDFGIAKTFDDGTQLTTTGVVIGTPHYMSPEQISGEPIDARSDLYSLGVILFEMLVGEVPFDAPTTTAVLIKHLNELPQRPSQRLPEAGIPPALESIAMRCLEKRRDDRFQTADELLDALEASATPMPSRPIAVTQAATEILPPPAKVVTKPTPAPVPEPKPAAVADSPTTLDSPKKARPASTPTRQPKRGWALPVLGAIVAIGALVVYLYWDTNTGRAIVRVPPGCTVYADNSWRARDSDATDQWTYVLRAGVHTVKTDCPTGQTDTQSISIARGQDAIVNVWFPEQQTIVEGPPGCKARGSGGALISDDGRYVAYATTIKCDQTNADYQPEAVLLDRSTGRHVRMGAPDLGMAMTPTGSRVVFAVAGSVEPHMLTVFDTNSGTSRTRSIQAPMGFAIGDLRLSGDGRFVTSVMSDLKKLSGPVFWADLDGTEQHAIGAGFNPRISRDGKWIAYNRADLDIVLVDREAVARGLGSARPLGVSGALLGFIDNDRRIAFVSERRYSADDTDSSADIYLIDPATSLISRGPVPDGVSIAWRDLDVVESGGVLFNERQPTRLVWFHPAGGPGVVLSTRKVFEFHGSADGQHVVANFGNPSGETQSVLLLIDRASKPK